MGLILYMKVFYYIVNRYNLKNKQKLSILLYKFVQCQIHLANYWKDRTQAFVLIA